MAGPGRNERCPCGSGRKVKRCCGVRRGPSEDELGKAFLAVEARAAALVLGDHDDEQLDELHDALIDLPSLDPSLLWPLPRLLTPELVRLGAALADEDNDTDAVRGLLQACSPGWIPHRRVLGWPGRCWHCAVAGGWVRS